MGQNKSNKNEIRNSETVEVLYQKMGNRWFAFSLIEDEVFVGSISQEEIDTGGVPTTDFVDMPAITENFKDLA